MKFDEASAAMHAVFMQRIAVWRQKEDKKTAYEFNL